MQKHCRDTENDLSVVLNCRLPVSTFSPNHWFWRCHLPVPHWAEIDRLAPGAERAREIKEKKQLAIIDAGAAAAAAQSEGETSSRRACGNRKADRGTQETWGRNGASTCLLEFENASSKVALSHTLFWERERKRRLPEPFISGLTLSVVQWEALWKALGIIELKEKSSAKCVLRTRKEAGRTWEVLVGWQWWPLKTSCSWWPVEDQARVAAAGAGIHFWCVGGLCVTHLSRSGVVSCTWGWDDFRRGHLGRMWRHSWQSASVRTTLTHLFVLDATRVVHRIRSCLALQSQLYSSYKSRTTLKDLIGISPNGSIYFVSELWSGPISDRELVIKSVMFCLSKTFLSSHSQAVLPFNFFFFFTFWLPSSVACWFAWLLHKHHVLSFEKKILIIAFTSIVLFQSPFFLTSLVFADSDGWFTSIMFTFKKLFSSHSRALLLSFTFCFSDTFGFLVNGSWSHDKLSAPYFVPCCTENIRIIEIDHILHCYHWMHFTKRLWEKVPTTIRHYRKRGSASYIVREWLLWVVERERETRLWRHRYQAEIASDHAYDYLDGASAYASTRSEPVECSKCM